MLQRIGTPLTPLEPMHAGGDWGGFICRALGTLHAKHVAAIHVNLAFATPSYTSPWHMLQARRPALPPARCQPGAAPCL